MDNAQVTRIVMSINVFFVPMEDIAGINLMNFSPYPLPLCTVTFCTFYRDQNHTKNGRLLFLFLTSANRIAPKLGPLPVYNLGPQTVVYQNVER